jgi:formylglycine-generating enzyme required for sulfatase activity
MIVVPAGSFEMGSPEGQGDEDEHPQHTVTIAKPFAVSKYELTFAAWDTCAAQGGCNPHILNGNFGRGQQPVIFVSWEDAQEYVKWLAKLTGKPYRLLTEAEYEYAARAGTRTVYPWGDDITLNGQAMANCKDCGSQWDGQQPAPVGSFPPNKFGLYDMVGNVWAWTEDCSNVNYQGAPANGSAWTSSNCESPVLRGGSWQLFSNNLRSAKRIGLNVDTRFNDLGFRVARTLVTP